MKTTLFWALHHLWFTWRERRFRAVCWWLSQQVEFLTWRLRVEAFVQSSARKGVPDSTLQGGRYVVHLL